MANESAEMETNLQNLAAVWADNQQKLWNSLLGLATDRDQRWESWYKLPLSVSENVVDLTLKTQSDWVNVWIKSLRSGNDGSDDLSNIFKGMDEMVDGWSESRRQLWDAWFTAVRQGGFFTGDKDAPDAMTRLLQVWAETGQNLMIMQSDYVSRMLGAAQRRPVSVTKSKKPVRSTPGEDARAA